MRLRPILACLTAIGALSAGAPAAHALEPVLAGAIAAHVVRNEVVSHMAGRDAGYGLICLDYAGVMPTRSICGLKARRRFYEAARSPERPIGPVSWIGPGYAPPTRPSGARRVAAPGGCGGGGQVAPCALAPLASGYGPYNSGFSR
jgi:hypothetical protein